MPATTQEYLSLPPVAADHRLAYGADPQQFGDLYLPHSKGPHAVVIALHGGCWLADYDLQPLGGLCVAIAAEGYAVWSLEYRRLGSGGGWPGTFEDVAAGADFLRTIAPQHALDLKRVVTLGHSAGGHLALWLAARLRVPHDSPLSSPHPLGIRGVLALAALADLAEGARLGLCGSACADLLGGTVLEHADRYRATSPAELLPLGVRQHHMVGRHDTIVPVDYLERYLARAAKYHEARLTVLPEAGHFELVMPDSNAWPAVRKALRGLF